MKIKLWSFPLAFSRGRPPRLCFAAPTRGWKRARSTQSSEALKQWRRAVAFWETRGTNEEEEVERRRFFLLFHRRSSPFLQRSSGLSRGLLRPPPSAHRKVSLKWHPSKRAESTQRAGGGGKAKSNDESNQSPPSPPPISACFFPSWSLSPLARGAPFLSRGSDRPRQRRDSFSFKNGATREKKKEQASKAKLEEKRRPAIAAPPPAALNQRERASSCSLALLFSDVPAASLAALGPVDRVPGVLHHGERTTKKKRTKKVCLESEEL